MLWQKEVQIDKLIGPSHSSESKLGWHSPCRLGRWSLPSASFPPESPPSLFPSFSGAFLVSFPHASSTSCNKSKKMCLEAGCTKCNFELEYLKPCPIFLKDPKDLNTLLLLKSLAVMEVIMGGFQLHKGGHEGSCGLGTMHDESASSVLLMPASCY